jgi:probable phosphoglycerate mutase
MQVTRLFLVRHGESQWNVEGRIQGHLDSLLTTVGLAQAEALAESLKAHTFSALYSSDLNRAYETARCIAKRKDQDILVDVRLRERNLGIFQGFTRPELETRFPEEAAYYKTQVDYVVPQGESSRQFYKRCVTCFEELRQKYLGGSILVVTHGGVLGMFLKYVFNIPLEAPRRFEILNTSINIFSYKQDHWVLEVWGSLAHLR